MKEAIANKITQILIQLGIPMNSVIIVRDMENNDFSGFFYNEFGQTIKFTGKFEQRTQFKLNRYVITELIINGGKYEDNI